ncbi:Hypothetical protein A7982_00262 [Minicystis rosea]|nr:Hypothetical protein A7982_00262 [Minicystis rosea]
MEVGEGDVPAGLTTGAARCPAVAVRLTAMEAPRGGELS